MQRWFRALYLTEYAALPIYTTGVDRSLIVRADDVPSGPLSAPHDTLAVPELHSLEPGHSSGTESRSSYPQASESYPLVPSGRPQSSADGAIRQPFPPPRTPHSHCAFCAFAYALPTASRERCVVMPVDLPAACDAASSDKRQCTSAPTKHPAPLLR
ncbi:hypothetical protein FKP32DRAFT_366195 [Trametes sanguinea]|nr:hypothetical protein FKP32DRAFT_366195 [Trametes sanguinea]